MKISNPFPKNPTIAKFFIQLGRVEELGSGVLNVSKLVREYTNGGEASFIDGDIFRMIIPVDDSVNPKVDSVNHENDSVNTIAERISDAVNKKLITKPNITTINGISEILYIINGHKRRYCSQGYSFADGQVFCNNIQISQNTQATKSGGI